MRKAGMSGGAHTAWAPRRTWLFSATLDEAEEKSPIGHVTSTEAAITASQTRGEVVAGL
jgi:hypothetical protein